MLLQPHTAYRLTHVLRRHGRRDHHWKTFDNDRYDLTIQVGTTVGFLGITFLCSCGERSSIDYFFHLSEDDHVYGRCMRPVILADDGSKMKLVLPSREWGAFQVAKQHPSFDDAYVHALAVATNQRHPNESSLRRFFETIHARVVLKRRMKGAFDRMYFRCLRKAYAPGGRCAQRARTEYDQNMLFL